MEGFSRWHLPFLRWHLPSATALSSHALMLLLHPPAIRKGVISFQDPNITQHQLLLLLFVVVVASVIETLFRSSLKVTKKDHQS